MQLEFTIVNKGYENDELNIRFCFSWRGIYRVASKISHYQIVKKSHYIVLQSAKKITFLRQSKVSDTTIISVDNKYYLCDLLCDVINNAW